MTVKIEHEYGSISFEIRTPSLILWSMGPLFLKRIQNEDRPNEAVQSRERQGMLIGGDHHYIMQPLEVIFLRIALVSLARQGVFDSGIWKYIRDTKQRHKAKEAVWMRCQIEGSSVI